MKKVWLLTLTMCLLTVPLQTAHASAVPRAGLEEKVVEHTLKNGMKLLMVERHTSPTVSAWIRFRVGSVDERSDERGIAHLLEHMLFKGTTTLGTKDYAAEKQILDKISEHINKASDLVEKMIEARKICNNIENTRTKAIAYQSQVKDTYFDTIRYHVDKLELLVDDASWYLPKYRELLFLR